MWLVDEYLNRTYLNTVIMYSSNFFQDSQN